MSESVYLFTYWPRVPKYHDYGEIRDNADVTRCGLTMYKDGKTFYSALLRRDHAECFAEPCRKCFPSGRAAAVQPPEEQRQ